MGDSIACGDKLIRSGMDLFWSSRCNPVLLLVPDVETIDYAARQTLTLCGILRVSLFSPRCLEAKV